MRIKELIEALAKYDPEAQVITSNGSGSYEYSTIDPLYRLTTIYKNGSSDSMLVTDVQMAYRMEFHKKHYPDCSFALSEKPEAVYIVQNEEIQIPKNSTPS